MAKKIFLILLICCGLFSCKSSYTKVGDKNANYIPYYLKVYEADSLYIVQDYKRSYEILDSLFKKYEPINMEVYKEYETYLLTSHLTMQKKNKTDRLLKKSFLIYGSKYEFLENDTLFKNIENKSKYKKNDLLIFSKRYTNGLDLNLRRTIENMVLIDKEIRLKTPIDNNLLAKVNKENSDKIKYIFNKYGYPSYEKIGYYDYNQKNISLETVFLHCNADFNNTFLISKLKEYVKKGQCNPHFYGSILDKNTISQNKNQYFGTFQDTPLIDSVNIDSIRKNIGLYSINYKKWRLKRKYGYEY